MCNITRFCKVRTADIYKRNGVFTKVGMGEDAQLEGKAGGEKSRLGKGSERMV